MYYSKPITGSDLPDKTICLTFDDGPGKSSANCSGPKTLELAQYLTEQEIGATFFVVGKYASQHPDILESIYKLGHLIANHSFDHPNLVHYANAGGDIEEQILRTDTAIFNWVDGRTIYFRPPYGSWSSGLADMLNKSLLVSMNHLGPISWDIDGGDWSFWEHGGTVKQAFAAYLQAIEKNGRGILLNHDCSATADHTRENNLTYELMLLLIPELKNRGYRFIRLDEITDIKLMTSRRHSFALQASTGFFVSSQIGGGSDILINSTGVGKWELITVNDLGFGKVALQAPNGSYYSPQLSIGGAVLANGTSAGPSETFDLIQLKNGRVAFRTITGHFLTRETASGGRLMATAGIMGDREIFNYHPFLNL